MTTPTNPSSRFEERVNTIVYGVHDWGFSQGAGLAFGDDDFEGIEPVLAIQAITAAAQTMAQEAVREARLRDTKAEIYWLGRIPLSVDTEDSIEARIDYLGERVLRLQPTRGEVMSGIIPDGQFDYEVPPLRPVPEQTDETCTHLARTSSAICPVHGISGCPPAPEPQLDWENIYEDFQMMDSEQFIGKMETLFADAKQNGAQEELIKMRDEWGFGNDPEASMDWDDWIEARLKALQGRAE